MRSVVVSDLHLGTRGRRDLLRRPAIRARLLEALAGADELVVLGDGVELRELALEEGLDAARPFLEDVAEALGGGRIVLVPGNHDHPLAEPVLAGVPRGELGVAQTLPPPAGGALGRLARRLGHTRLELAYPGLWLRPGVYATHGHYLDLHNTVPTLEILALAGATRVLGGAPGPAADPGDYEAVLGRLYAALFPLGRAAGPGHGEVGADLSLRVWQKLTREDGSGPGRMLAEVVFPAAVAGINRLGLGPFRADLSGPELRRAGLRAMGEVVGRLGIEADWVLFGHTHRSGPWPGTDEQEEWTTPSGARLVNTGSWVYQPSFLPKEPAGSPYWPGVLCVVEDDRPPVLRALLADAGHEELRA